MCMHHKKLCHLLTLVWILCWTLNQRLPQCSVLTVASVAAIMIAMFFLRQYNFY